MGEVKGEDTFVVCQFCGQTGCVPVGHHSVEIRRHIDVNYTHTYVTDLCMSCVEDLWEYINERIGGKDEND